MKDAPKINASKEGRNWTLWLWVGAGFLFLATLWGAMFFFAGEANVQSVPLATKEGRP